MKMPEKISNLATQYFLMIRGLQKRLRQSEKARASAEKELEEAREKIDKLEKEKNELQEENDNLKECRKTYARMLFKGKTKQVNEPKRGQKKGHVGVSRKKPAEEEIQMEVDVELVACTKCGTNFSGCKRIYEHVTEDIVIQPKREIVKYWIHQYECKKCGEKVSAKSPNIIGQSPFGRKIFAAVLLYRDRMKTPLKKIVECLKEIHGFEVSEGGIQNLLYQAAVQFGEKYEQLKQLVVDGEIINADETGWRVNGENWWTWLWSNDKVTVYTTENTRGHGIPEKMLKNFKGLLTRDGCDSYNGVESDQQICWVHMLRKAHEYCERDKASPEMILLKDTLKCCYKRMMKWHRKDHSWEERQEYHTRMKQLFMNLAKQRQWKAKDAKTFVKEWLIQHENHLVTFLKYPRSRPENNDAERSVRPMVIFRKITGGSKSEKGIRATDINMSIIETWKKQKLSIINQLPVFGFNLYT
jgi:transposase